ncbi:MAG: hypothetical protein JJ992_26755, partial [Planctomycetes bacterium]|nr:hypothetical protein [Planctomycetota bacterium]
MNFSLDGKSTRIVACTDDNAVKGKRVVRLTLAVDTLESISLDANASSDPATCWNAYLSERWLGAIKNGGVLVLSLDHRISFRVDLTGSARALNIAWKYVEDRLVSRAHSAAPPAAANARTDQKPNIPPEVAAAVIDSTGTVPELHAVEYNSSGQLPGCGVNFVLLSTDSVYANGNLVMLGGSLNTFFKEATVPAWILKLKGAELSLGPSGDVNPIPFAIHDAYLSGSGLNTDGRTNGAFECEDKQSLCVVFDGTQYAKVFSSLFEDDLRIAYSRVPGGLDAVSPVLSFAKAPNGRVERDKARACFARLLERFQNSLESRYRNSYTAPPSYQQGYEWAKHNSVSRFDDCQRHFGASEAEDGC